MIGQRIESRSRFPWGALALLAIALGLVGVAAVQGVAAPAIGAILPFALAVLFWWNQRERPWAATFTEEGVAVEDAPNPLSYENLRFAWADGFPHDPEGFRKTACAIEVEHSAGRLRIPSRLNVPSHEVYRFVAGQIPPSAEGWVNPLLAEYVERQVGYYGPEHVWTYRAARGRKRPSRYRGWRAICLALMVAGVAWMAIGFSGLADMGWQVAGVMATIFGAIFLAVTFSNLELHSDVAGRIKKPKESSLVITPQGLAMVQGDIQGEIRWAELLDVRYKRKPSRFTLTYQATWHGIILKVKGAEIRIADIYDRPLYVIHERIMAYRGVPSQGGWDPVSDLV